MPGRKKPSRAPKRSGVGPSAKSAPTTAAAPKPAASKTGRDGGPEEAASHISDVLTDLARLARRHKLDMLGFLIDMALMEAREVVRFRRRRARAKR